MSAHQQPSDWLRAPWTVADPGNAGTLDLTAKGRGYCKIKTTGAETRTIPAPVAIGQQLSVYMDTDGGDCVITVTSGVSGLATITLNDTGDLVVLEALTIADVLKWQYTLNRGATIA